MLLSKAFAPAGGGQSCHPAARRPEPADRLPPLGSNRAAAKAMNRKEACIVSYDEWGRIAAGFRGNRAKRLRVRVGFRLSRRSRP
jgi:hypothetical protein